MQALIGEHIHMDRKRTDGIEQAAARRAGHLRHGAGRIQKCGGFSHHAADRQNNAGQNTRHRTGQHDLHHRAQTARAQTKAALPVSIGNGQQDVYKRQARCRRAYCI